MSRAGNTSKGILSVVPHHEPGAPGGITPNAYRDRSPAPSEDATVPKLAKLLNAAVALRTKAQVPRRERRSAKLRSGCGPHRGTDQQQAQEQNLPVY
jgi:hypothetical protein